MHIIAISDTHGLLPEIPPCDLLIIAGDVCPVDNHAMKYQEYWIQNHFDKWLTRCKLDGVKEIVGIAGNHDFVLQKRRYAETLDWHYLKNNHIVLGDLKIFGSPMTPRFGNWAFMNTEAELAGVWNTIEPDTNILITHGPPYEILDFSFLGMQHSGSTSMRNYLEYTDHNITNMFFGHIHEGWHDRGNRTLDLNGVSYHNCSYVDQYYHPTEEMVVVHI